MKRLSKRISILLLSLFIISMLSVTVSAQQTGGEKMSKAVGNLGEMLTSFFTGLAERTITLPTDYVVGDSNEVTVSVLAVLATFFLVFTLLYAASGKIKVFEGHTGARKGFTFSVAALVTFLSPLALVLQRILGTSAVILTYAYVAAIVLLAYWLWSMFGTGFSKVSRQSAERKQFDVDSEKIKQEAIKDKDQLNHDRKMVRREKESLDNLEKLTKDDFKNEKNLQTRFEKLLDNVAKMESVRGERAQELKQQIVDEATNLLKIESHAHHINNELEKITKDLEKSELEIVKDLSDMDAHVLNHIRNRLAHEGRSTTPDNMDRVLTRAKNLAKKVLKAQEEAESMVGNIDKYESDIERKTKEIIELLRADEFPGAANRIKEVLDEIKKEKMYTIELRKLSERIKDSEKKDFKLVYEAKKDLDAAAGAPRVGP